MATEIERKFLVKNNDWRDSVIKSIRFRQGYLSGTVNSSVRVRIEGEQAYLNIKSATLGIRRHEYEYAIPLQDATEMLNELCNKPLVEKRRSYVIHDGHTWEIDEFEGENEGLIVAEIELTHEDEEYSHPDWLGEEVSDDIRYYNVNLVKHPYKTW